MRAEQCNNNQKGSTRQPTQDVDRSHIGFSLLENISFAHVDPICISGKDFFHLIPTSTYRKRK